MDQGVEKGSLLSRGDVLTCTKAYLLEMDPTLLDDGFLEFNTDYTPFTDKDYLSCVKETWGEDDQDCG